MSMIRWRRRQDLPSLLERMQTMLGDLGREGTNLMPFWPEAESAAVPAVDMYETDTEVVIRAELPGVKREDIQVNAEKNLITIRGESKFEAETEETGYYRRELRYGSFSRSLPTPTDIDHEHVAAKFDDGILTIRAPKTEEEPTGRSVEIS